ncbi:MAG: radical SAM family heme chaperone HemW [Gemmiger sp.]|nr:radical SAM family heme chaperone HemW [Gemmiger sp.]
MPNQPNQDSFGIYLHIPYCPAKCRYCDFYAAPGSKAVPQGYQNALLRQLAANTRRPDTLYFGGGTPALLSPAQVAALIEAANPNPGAEITLEANPDVVSPERLAGFRAAGVNRISFGVQSASDAQLKRLGRTHTAATAAQALAAARAAGFDELCGDIMLALPGYTNAEFEDTLALLQGEGCTHISAYLLKVEPGTAFYRNPPPNLPDPDRAADFYLYAVERLAQAGYRQYEISNFCPPGHEGRHNLLYWNCQDYLGIGPAAHSCLGGQRRFWPSDTPAFISGQLTEEVEGVCNAEDYMILQLRLATGLDLAALQAGYGVTLSPRQLNWVVQCTQHGYATFDGRRLCLTPAGMIVQNAILAELI